MLDLPDAKRVRREDIREALGSGWLNSSDDEGIDEQLHARMREALGLFSPPSPSPQKTGAMEKATPSLSPEDAETCADQSKDGDLGEFEFRLFSTAGSRAKVVLQSENEAQGEGGIVSRRPSSYYLVQGLPIELRRQYESAAVSGEDVLARSRWRSWGLELPWKVSHITAATASTNATWTAGASGSAGRKRPGKKARLAVRRRERVRKLAAEDAAEKQMCKEEHIKDKKKRLNRAKKLRRRAKDKQKKMEADGCGAAGEADGSDSD